MLHKLKLKATKSLNCQTALTELDATRSLDIINMAYSNQLQTCAMPVGPPKGTQARATEPASATTACRESPLDAPKATSQMYPSSLGSCRVAGRWSHVDVGHSETVENMSRRRNPNPSSRNDPRQYGYSSAGASASAIHERLIDRHDRRWHHKRKTGPRWRGPTWRARWLCTRWTEM